MTVVRRSLWRGFFESVMGDNGFPDWRWPESPVPYVEADLFENWLVERWRHHIRSEAFEDSAECQYLRAEFEREMGKA